MSKIKPQSIKPGDLFYECASGMNIEAVAVSPVVESKSNFDKDRKQWSWTARNTQTGDLINYLQTEGLEHYGPRLYSSPQYVRLMDKDFPAPLLGGEDYTQGDPEQDALREPEILKDWVEAMGNGESGKPVSDWVSESIEPSYPSDRILEI